MKWWEKEKENIGEDKEKKSITEIIWRDYRRWLEKGKRKRRKSEIVQKEWEVGIAERVEEKKKR